MDSRTSRTGHRTQTAAVRRLCALLVGLSCVAAEGRAQATDEEGWDGAYVPFLAMLGALPGAIPYLAMLTLKDPGYVTAGYNMGAGQRVSAFAVGADLGGYPRRDSRFGFMGRSHFDAFGKSGLMALRLDALALAILVGDARGPLVLEGIGGLTVVPHWLTKSTSAALGAGVGPAIGARVRAVTLLPRLDTELELLYRPLFGEPVSERLHHVSATSALAFSPGGGFWDACTVELRGRVEWAWGGADVEGGRPDASLVVGLRFSSGAAQRADEAKVAAKAAKQRR